MYDAPHYLYGDARIRWHRRQAKKNYAKAAVTAGTTAVLYSNKTGPFVAAAAAAGVTNAVGRTLGRHDVSMGPIWEANNLKNNQRATQEFRWYHRNKIAALGAAGTAGFAGAGVAHTVKAKKYEKEYNARRKKTPTQAFHSTKAYYFRKQGGKMVRVRKGKRK